MELIRWMLNQRSTCAPFRLKHNTDIIKGMGKQGNYFLIVQHIYGVFAAGNLAAFQGAGLQ
jgi:hypothetical protein